jgi:hypothetical protein
MTLGSINHLAVKVFLMDAALRADKVLFESKVRELSEPI